MFQLRWEQEAQREVRAKFLGMAAPLRGRPAGCRSQFDEAGGARQTPGWSTIRAGRACLDAAADKGEATLAATRRACRDYCDALYAAMVHGYEPTDVSVESAIVALARDEAEASALVTEYAVKRDPALGPRLLREVGQVEQDCARVLSLGSRMQLPEHPIPLGAVR